LSLTLDFVRIIMLDHSASMKSPYLLLPLFVAARLWVMLGTGCGLKPTKAQVVGMFEKAGGINSINQESVRIFQQFGTNESRVIYGSELTNYPGLSSVGKPLFLRMTTLDSSAHIEIPIGSHWNRTFIFIFDPGRPFQFRYQTECFQIASNIFVGR
jgi:hypothetical protein